MKSSKMQLRWVAFSQSPRLTRPDVGWAESCTFCFLFFSPIIHMGSQNLI